MDNGLELKKARREKEIGKRGKKSWKCMKILKEKWKQKSIKMNIIKIYKNVQIKLNYKSNS